MSTIVRTAQRHLKLAVLASVLCGGAAMFVACDADDAPCTSDYDCAEELVCEMSTGKCATYGCRSCSDTEICVDNKCAAK